MTIGNKLKLTNYIEAELKDFEEYWLQICNDLETVEMSKNDALIWKAKFQVASGNYLVFNLSHPSLLPLRIANRLNKIGHKLDIALLKAKANYRNKERMHLKNQHPSLGPLISFISAVLNIYDKVRNWIGI